MENASKALLMAGGVLIAILIIVLLVNSFTSISSLQQTKLSEEEQEKLVKFNEQYTKYAGQYVYGTEVRSVMNKSENNGFVTVIVLPKGSEPPTNIGQDTQYYKCPNDGIKYNDQTGRVEEIIFEKVEINQSEE